ncbi:uncharacterized protein LOC116666012 isoform X3 [Camelus ferus]|uniref:Uncharacterized protein LOC116666012 isoform X3 n=1 Tax=Camelus ferus TaxID=419612 RepID=A0A8B8TND1_CAMFR|nr:uncharacterized protein LOC116666012 isoform X3 [Camelus ferus]
MRVRQFCEQHQRRAMKGKAPFRVWAGPEGEATGISSTAVALAALAEAGQAPATSQPQSGRPDPVRSLTVDPVSSWEEDRKFVLRGWCLVFSILATLMVLSVLDGRMAYLQGSYTGYLGFWTDCRKHKCVSLGQVTVLIHMSMGFMMLALVLCLVLLPTMSLSFRPVFRRLNKADLVFSSLSLSIGFLIVLSLTLFVVNCETLQPRPQVSYLMTTYLCWSGGALMLWAAEHPEVHSSNSRGQTKTPSAPRTCPSSLPSPRPSPKPL